MADVVQLPVNVRWALPTCRIELALLCSRLAQRPRRHKATVLMSSLKSPAHVGPVEVSSGTLRRTRPALCPKPLQEPPVRVNPSCATRARRGFSTRNGRARARPWAGSVERNPGTRRRSACFCVPGAGRGDPCDKAVPRFLGRDAPAAHCRSRGPLHTSYRPTLISCPPVPTQKPSVVA